MAGGNPVPDRILWKKYGTIGWNEYEVDPDQTGVPPGKKRFRPVIIGKKILVPTDSNENPYEEPGEEEDTGDPGTAKDDPAH